MSAVRPATVLGALSAFTLALSAWLFLPRQGAGAPYLPRLDVVLVDVSASAARARGWFPWARAELRRRAEEVLAEQAELAVVSFANGVATDFNPGPPAAFLDQLMARAGQPFDPRAGLDPGGTQLAAALAAVEPLLVDPRRPAGTLTLLAPLTYTGVSPADVLARLSRTGVTLAARPPPPPEESDLGLVELALAPRVEAGGPLIALARCTLRRGTAIGTSGPASAELDLELEGEEGARSFTRALPLPDQDGVFEFPIDCGQAGPGRTEVAARCRLSTGPDLCPENDVARASTLAAGARVIGVVCTEEERAAARAWLVPSGRSALSGLQFVFLSPERFERELDGLDALISFDLRPSELSALFLGPFVEAGGGWLALSGWRFLGDWIPGAPEGELQRLLPCEPGRTQSPPREVVLLIDGSGSMEGAAFETVRTAALDLVAAALPSDRVSLRFFTTRLEEEHVLKERARNRAEDAEAARAAARELLALRVPAGTTFLLRSLQELRAPPTGEEQLALLLTDGWEREALPDVLTKARAVEGELARQNTRLVVIAVGEPNLPLLAALAGGADRVQRGETLADLRTVFHRELFGAQLAEGRIELRYARRAPGSLAAEIASPAAEAPVLAPLERHVHDRLRPGAEALWESASGEPVLALARAGLGRTALFASRPTPGWASAYAARAGLGEPAEFAGLLRWLARGPEHEPGLRARFEGDLLSVAGFAADDPAIVPAKLLERRAGMEREQDLRLLASGTLGEDVLRTRSAGPVRFVTELDEPVLLVARRRVEDPWRAVAIQRALSDEFAQRELHVPGAWLKSTEPVPVAAARSASHPAGPWVLALGLLLLFSTALLGTGVKEFGGTSDRRPGEKEIPAGDPT